MDGWKKAATILVLTTIIGYAFAVGELESISDSIILKPANGVVEVQGKLGVGTEVPSQKLHVFDDGNRVWARFQTSRQNWSLGFDSSDDFYLVDNDAGISCLRIRDGSCQTTLNGVLSLQRTVPGASQLSFRPYGSKDDSLIIFQNTTGHTRWYAGTTDENGAFKIYDYASKKIRLLQYPGSHTYIYTGNNRGSDILFNAADDIYLQADNTIRAGSHLRVSGFSGRHAMYFYSGDRKYAMLTKRNSTDNGGRFEIYTNSGGITLNSAENIHLKSKSDVIVDGSIVLSGTVRPANSCGIAGAAFTAEENAVLNDNSYEYSFGNGAEGADIASAQACSGEITAMSISCRNPSKGTAKIHVRNEGVDTGCFVEMSDSKTAYTQCSGATFNAGQKLNAYTETASGAGYCVVTWWVRYD